MGEALVYRLGEVKRLTHTVTAEADVTLTGGAVTIKNLDTGVNDTTGTATVAPLNDTDSDNDATQWEAYFIWTPAVAGDYEYTLGYVLGAQTFLVHGFAIVWPAWSKLDRYIRRVQDYLQESEAGELQQRLSLRDYRNAMDAAVNAFSDVVPRRVHQDFTLTSALAYALPTGAAFTPTAPWVNEFSRVVNIELPRETANAGRTVLLPSVDYRVDERAGEWELEWSPTSGDTARVEYTVRHTLSHTQDTLPTSSFEAICLWAAGWCMAHPMSATAATSEDPDSAAGIVSYGTQFERRIKLGMDMMKRAAALWSPIGRREWWF